MKQCLGEVISSTHGGISARVVMKVAMHWKKFNCIADVGAVGFGDVDLVALILFKGGSNVPTFGSMQGPCSVLGGFL